MAKDEIQNTIYSKIDELPTLPAVVPKLLSLLESEKSTASDITKVITYDPALTSKILKVANSAYYGFPRVIADLDRALALLGFNMIKSLALSMGVMKSLPSSKGAMNFSLTDLWLHSVRVAIAMKEMSNRFGKNENMDHLFIVGLLHDIGMIVFNQFFGDQFQEVLEEVGNQEKSELCLVEKKIIGIDHGEVGAMLLKRWKFPSMIIKPIALHNTDILPNGKRAKDLAMLRIAESICHDMIDDEGSNVVHDIRECDLQILNIKENHLREMSEYLVEEEEGIKGFFNAMN